jgi:hypothetical protein
LGTTYQPGQSANYIRVHEVVYLGGDDAAEAKREKMIADIKTAAAEVIIKYDTFVSIGPKVRALRRHESPSACPQDGVRPTAVVVGGDGNRAGRLARRWRRPMSLRMFVARWAKEVSERGASRASSCAVATGCTTAGLRHGRVDGEWLGFVG